MAEASDQESPPEPIRTPDAVRIALFRDWKESQRATFAVAAEYGKWLTASLLLIHGGALVGLFSVLNSLADKPELIAGYRWPAWSFIAGLIFALLAGFCTWLNWSMHSDNYNAQANYAMLTNPEAWLLPAKYSRGILITYWGSILAGWASALAILVGAALLLHGHQLLVWLRSS